MENNQEILEVELELGDGSKQILFIKEVESDEWSDIPKGTKGLICLVNNQQMIIEIQLADYDGVSFKIIDGGKHTYRYEESVISNLFIEVTQPKNPE
jgi:5,10-methenyltetrahydromethanopterin hydrogenase